MGALGAIGLCLALCAAASAAPSARTVARVWSVTGTGATPEQARQLAAALGLEAALRQADGSLEYINSDRFLGAPMLDVDEAGRDEHEHPTVTRAFDPEALAKLTVLPDKEALKRAQRALKDARLLPAGAHAKVGHARLTLYDAQGRVKTGAALDTSVSFGESLGGIPLRGPGAKVRVSFDGDGAITHLRYARRDLRAGPAVHVITPDEAKERCADRYGPSAARADITAELVYFAPALSLRGVQRIVPHYACGGALPAGVELEEIMVPAVQDAPRVELDVDVSSTRDGSVVRAHANVASGRPPYSFVWGSSHTPLDAAAASAGPDISYEPTGINVGAPERLEVSITDADGLTASSASIEDVVLKLSADTEPTDEPTVGLEWLFGLEEAQGFWGAATHSTNNIEGVFNKPPDEARERDFKDPAFGGSDTLWADAVDLAFYKGHANGSGWVMQTAEDDDFVHYSETRFGNRDLEWLVIEACGPLRPLADGKDVIERWGPAFAGLHMILGYATVATVVPGQAEEFAEKIVAFGNVSEETLVDAWVESAINAQSGDIEYAAMGPTIPKLILTGPGGQQPKIVNVSNYDDYFWDRGPTTSDIATPLGYWVLQGPVD